MQSIADIGCRDVCLCYTLIEGHGGRLVFTAPEKKKELNSSISFLMDERLALKTCWDVNINGWICDLWP